MRCKDQRPDLFQKPYKGTFKTDAVGEFRISIEITFPAMPYEAIVGADGVCPADPGGRRPPLHEFANRIKTERTLQLTARGMAPTRSSRPSCATC
jgi:hypothetical protein